METEPVMDSTDYTGVEFSPSLIKSEDIEESIEEKSGYGVRREEELVLSNLKEEEEEEEGGERQSEEVKREDGVKVEMVEGCAWEGREGDGDEVEQTDWSLKEDGEPERKQEREGSPPPVTSCLLQQRRAAFPGSPFISSGFSKCEELLHAIADNNSDLEVLSDGEDSPNTVPPEREDSEKEDAGQQSSDSDSSDCESSGSVQKSNDEDCEPKSRSISRGRGRRGSESNRCGRRRQHGQSMVARARGRGQRKDQEVADKPGTSGYGRGRGGRGRKRQRKSVEGGPGPSNDGTQPGVEQRDDGETESDEDYVPSGTPEDDEIESAESEPQNSPPPSSPGRQDVWTNAEFTPNLVKFAAQDDDDGNRREEREEWQPLDYMEQYIDTELMKVLADKSNAEYLKRTGKNLNTSADELHHFFGASIFLSCVPYPHVRMYWSTAFKVTAISDKMARDRFFKLRQNLKVVFDNDIEEEERKADAFWKVRPFMARVLNGCLRQDRPESVSIDEQMIPFTGACPYRQYVPLKSNPVGLKNFVVASPDGIILDFDVYQGAPKLAAQVQDSEGLGLGSLVVERLAETLPAGTKVYCDRFFTSVKTLDRMLKKKIYVTGTVTKNRIRAAAKKLPSDKTMKRQGRGTTAYVTRKDGKACLLKWYDNKPVMMLSTVHAKEPQDTCRRWCKKEGRYIPVIRPSIVREYNAKMGGVDLNDRMISYHRMKTRTRKWPLRMTMHFMDLALANSWILYRKDQRQRRVPEKRIMQFLEFRMEVARTYLAKQGCDEVQQEQEDDQPHNDRRFTALPPVAVRIANAGHLPDMVDLKNPMRCRVKDCTGKSRVRCVTCNVFLCLQNGRNCYAAFHSK